MPRLPCALDSKGLATVINRPPALLGDAGELGTVTNEPDNNN